MYKYNQKNLLYPKGSKTEENKIQYKYNAENVN